MRSRDLRRVLGDIGRLARAADRIVARKKAREERDRLRVLVARIGINANWLSEEISPGGHDQAVP